MVFHFAMTRKLSTFAIEIKNKMSNESARLIKTIKNMKTTFKSMMVIGMMILGTATTFAKSNVKVDKFEAHKEPQMMTVHKDCRLRHTHDRHCGNSFQVRMDKKMNKHFLERKHKFDKHGVCKKCHLTKHEIPSVEREMGLHHPTPPPAHRPHPHNHRR